ncbi:MAG: hypothetical protein IJX47_09345 [Clostridia bacterium]|nr:hypothetical protein [Clostridia bacterium]
MTSTEKDTIIAYRCPRCGAGVLSVPGIFSLTGDLLKLKCACGESELNIERQSDGKLRLAVPCIVCAKPHVFVLAQNSFSRRTGGVFRLPCPYTGLDLCFVGGKDAVQDAIQEADDDLLALMREAGLEDIEQLHAGDEMLEAREQDPQVADIVRYALRELDDEGKITCNCQNNAIADYKFRLHDGEVTVWCEECGASVTLPLAGVTMAEDFLQRDSLELS